MIKIENKIKEVTKELNFEQLNAKTTLVVTVDMINGFIREGVLASNRVEGIVEEVVRINKKLDKAQKLFFVDEHEEDSKEFEYFPKHCIKGSSESKIIDELIPYIENALIIGKNSTNGYVTKEFNNYFNENKEYIKDIVIVGCCTDICVKCFCISLITAINQSNLNINVIVPINAVETYDLYEHEAKLINTMALYDMQLNGVKLCKFN